MDDALDDGVRASVEQGVVLRSVSFAPRGGSASRIAGWLRRTNAAVGLHAIYGGAPLPEQVRAFQDHLGAPPAFINSHKHLHILPALRDRLIEAAVSGGVRAIRNPVDLVAHRLAAPWWPLRPRMLAWPLASQVARGVAPKARARGLVCPDGMVGGLHMGRLSMGVLDELWPLLRGGPSCVEVVVHPRWRSAERVALTAPLLAATLAHEGLAHIDYRAVT